VILTLPLSTIFVFSLTLQSASPRLVLYMQLAEDSLSSVPITDSLEQISGQSTEESFLEAGRPRTSGGTCYWVDPGNTLLFNSADLHQ
jgi:UDP-glucose:glycoprotein glucosyltransferase